MLCISNIASTCCAVCLSSNSSLVAFLGSAMKKLFQSLQTSPSLVRTGSENGSENGSHISEFFGPLNARRIPRIEADAPPHQALPFQVLEDLEDASRLLWVRWVLRE